MNKGQKRTLISLSCLVAALSIALALLSWTPEPKLLPTLLDLSPEAVTALRYTNSYGEMDLVRTENGWQLADDPAFPVNQTQLDAMVQILCTARPTEKIGSENAEEYGLTQPQCALTVTAGSGKHTLNIGTMNAVNGQLYVQADGGAIWLTDPALLRAFHHSLLDLSQPAAIPKPEEHLRVEIENFNGKLLLSCLGSETGGEDGVWYVQTEDGFVEADQTVAYSFYFLTWDMAWRSTAAYLDGDADLNDYGLRDPQVHYRLTYPQDGAVRAFSLYLGSNLPDNTSYAMVEGSPLIHTIDQVLTRWLAEATVSTLLPKPAQ